MTTLNSRIRGSDASQGSHKKEQAQQRRRHLHGHYSRTGGDRFVATLD